MTRPDSPFSFAYYISQHALLLLGVLSHAYGADADDPYDLSFLKKGAGIGDSYEAIDHLALLKLTRIQLCCRNWSWKSA